MYLFFSLPILVFSFKCILDWSVMQSKKYSEKLMFFQVRHPKITKGYAMKKILREKLGENWHETHSAIFIGDSSTDEEGFATLLEDSGFRSDCVTFIKIQTDNSKPTRGKHIFSGPDDVYTLLCELNNYYLHSAIVN